MLLMLAGVLNIMVTITNTDSQPYLKCSLVVRDCDEIENMPA